MQANGRVGRRLATPSPHRFLTESIEPNLKRRYLFGAGGFLQFAPTVVPIIVRRFVKLLNIVVFSPLVKLALVRSNGSGLPSRSLLCSISN
jgi:hypothetical protein